MHQTIKTHKLPEIGRLVDLINFMELMPDAAVLSNSEGTIVNANHRAELLLGYQRGELLQHPIEILMPLQMRHAHVPMRDQYARSPHVRELGSVNGLMAATKDGKTVPVDIMLSPVMMKGERHTLAVIRNLTQIAKHNRALTQSINYAKRIQDALLPHEEDISNFFPDHLIFYRPKQIVSGDFYWFHQVGDQAVMVAADCTGHGVPGGFMSMLGHNALNHVVLQNKIFNPARILHMLDEYIRKTLGQDDRHAHIRDGMDMAVCVVDRKRNIMAYSGANRPLCFFQRGELKEVKGSRFPIGSGQHPKKQFNNQVFRTQKGDTAYVFSDGIADQFGGAYGKKYSNRRLRCMLEVLQGLSFAEQKEMLENDLNQWQRNEKQIDDMLLLGLGF